MDRWGVPRQRLLRRIGPSDDLARLTAVVAPIGYGKSTLLRQWLARAPSDVVATVDPRELVGRADLAGAIDPLGPRVVVVDDAHLLAPAVVEEIVAEVDAVQASGRRWILAGRRFPGSDLVHRQLRGQVLLLGPRELAFDDDELSQLASTAGATAGSVTDAGRWPALAASVLAGEEDRVIGYLRDLVLPSCETPVALLLAAVCLAGDGSASAIDALIAALDLPAATADELAGVPLVDSVLTRGRGGSTGTSGPDGHGGVVIDERWLMATASLLPRDAARSVLSAMVEVVTQRGELGEAGRFAVAAGDAGALEGVVRQALGSQPPRIGLDHLDLWARADGLGVGTRAWIQATAATLRDPVSDRGARQLEEARAAFAAAGDLEGEIGAIGAAGLHARRRGDVETIAALLGRMEELGPSSHPTLQAFTALAHAVMGQLAGRHGDALAALDDVALDELDPAWRAQVEMVRSANLLLLGRVADAIGGFERATGTGSRWTRSVAHDLLSLARWVAGDRAGAQLDAARACSLATARAVPGLASAHEAWRSCLDALERSDIEPTATPTRPRGSWDESDRLRAVATALRLAGLGQDDDAASMLASVRDLPDRAVRSTTLVAALETALERPRSAHWATVAEANPGLRPAVDAGVAAAAHRAGGPPPPASARPYLPQRWWGPHAQIVHVRVLGSHRITVGARPGDERNLARGRVRELLLHLVLVPSASRVRRTEDVWPDLPPDRGASNLRVTLTQLLDVLHPERERGAGSDLIDDGAGRLDLVLGSRLHVDAADLRAGALRCARLLRAGDREAALAVGRTLLDLVDGHRLIDDAGVGSWIDRPRRALEEIVLRAFADLGPEALEVGDHDLAEQLGSAALVIDPWSEAAGRLVVDGRLRRGDPDGARRALAELVARLRELGLHPMPATQSLIARLGVPPPGGPSLAGRDLSG